MTVGENGKIETGPFVPVEPTAPLVRCERWKHTVHLEGGDFLEVTSSLVSPREVMEKIDAAQDGRAVFPEASVRPARVVGVSVGWISDENDDGEDEEEEPEPVAPRRKRRGF